MSLCPRSVVLIAVVLWSLCSIASAQAPAQNLPEAPLPQNDTQQSVSIGSMPQHILEDQEVIWTSPARIRDANAAGPILLVVATALTMTIDHQAMSSSKIVESSLNSHSETASNGLVGGFVAAPVIIYGLGHIHHNDHATETGILGGEAIVDSLAVNEVLKIVSRRERPAVDNAKGKFFQSGVNFDSSFPSNHSIVAWSSAAVIASEYNGPMTKLTAYGLATGLSVSRVLARQHFPSDVVAGSVIGWMIGRYVFHRHAQVE